MIVPGSGLVKSQAEDEGLDKVFKEAGFDWREAGCSMCLGMNPDQLSPGERCASTSNRNFEGRQGKGGRTHLVSPAMAAAAAVAGHLVDVRELLGDVSADGDITDSKYYAQQVGAAAPPAPTDTTVATGEATGMEPFTTLQGVAAPLPLGNVDTDMIIPKQFLKTIKRSGLGICAFNDLRYLEDGAENPSFVLNQDPYRSAVILITGDNFGCGSSREHAPWAILDLGIKCIIGTSFADIFFNNCFKNGMLPIQLPAEQVAVLMVDAEAKQELAIDLEAQSITRANGEVISFEVDAFRKHCLVNGLDDIGLTMAKSASIATFEQKRSATYPWLDGPGYNTEEGAVRLQAAGGSGDPKAQDW